MVLAFIARDHWWAVLAIVAACLAPAWAGVLGLLVADRLGGGGGGGGGGDG